MRTRKRAVPRLEALRYRVHQMLFDYRLKKFEVAAYCGLSLSQSGRWFCKFPMKGRPRAAATLRLLQLICKKLEITLPVPSWACLQAFGWNRIVRRGGSYQKIASATGTHRTAVHRYLKTWDDEADGEWALDFLAYFLRNEGSRQLYSDYFCGDCSEDFEKPEFPEFAPALLLSSEERAVHSEDAKSLIPSAKLMYVEFWGNTWSLPPELIPILGPRPSATPPILIPKIDQG